MKPLVIKPVNQLPQSEPSKISVDMAEQIADKAATRAAQEVSRENMENFNRFQEQNKISQEQISPERNNRDSIYEESEGGYSIDTKTEKNLMRRLLDQTLQKALDPPPPSPIENAVTQVMGQVSAGIAEKMLGNISGGQVASKSGLLSDILNSQFGAGLGQNLGAKIPEIITSLTSSIGQQKAQELASAATKVMSQGQSEQQNTGNLDSSNEEKQKNIILALDINKPEDVSQYAKAMGLTIKAAQGMLQVHQDDILTERRNKSISVDNNQSINNNDIAQALNILIKEMTGMKDTINNLQNKIVTIEGSTLSQSSKLSQQNRNVNLFSTPIKVDIDDIKGNTDSFFDETPTNTSSKIEKENKPEESVLEEIVDSEGKSTFKMSDEKEQPKKITEKEQLKPVTEKTIIEKPIEIEQDKKKVDVDTVINEQIIGENGVKQIEIEQSENKQPDDNQVIIKEIESKKIEPKKRIIKKSILIKKDTQDVPSHITEKYDINNNLMTEDTIK